MNWENNLINFQRNLKIESIIYLQFYKYAIYIKDLFTHID